MHPRRTRLVPRYVDLDSAQAYWRRPEASRDRSRSVRVTRMARYLLGNGDEVVCEMEHFPKHGISSFSSLGIVVTVQIGVRRRTPEFDRGQLSVRVSAW
jgi:hypothetical protein